MACSTILGRRPEQPVLSFAPFPFSPQCNLWPFPCPLFPCPRTSTPGCVRCGAIFERVCSRPQSKTCGKKASPLKAGRSPRGFCLQVFSSFCASRSLDRGMGTREWSNLRFIRSRCIPLPCASNRRRHLRALELLRYPRALNLVDEAMACSTILGRRPEQPVLSFAPFSFSPQCNLWPFPCPHSLVQERVRRGA